jgi:outer membrane lipopolysaccharide assembly protein LptE/RlpB
MRYCAFAYAALLCLGGCGTHLPDLVDKKILPLEDLVQDIDCEFQDAVREQIYLNGRAWLKTWQGQYTITREMRQAVPRSRRPRHLFS